MSHMHEIEVNLKNEDVTKINCLNRNLNYND